MVLAFVFSWLLLMGLPGADPPPPSGPVSHVSVAKERMEFFPFYPWEEEAGWDPSPTLSILNEGSGSPLLKQ